MPDIKKPRSFIFDRLSGVKHIPRYTKPRVSWVKLKTCPTMPVLERQTCAICLDTIRNTCRELHCQHVYCPPCIDKWLSKQATCPVCKRGMIARAPTMTRRAPQHPAPRRVPRERAMDGQESVPIFATTNAVYYITPAGLILPQDHNFTREMQKHRERRERGYIALYAAACCIALLAAIIAWHRLVAILDV